MALHGATLALARSVSALVYDLNLPDAGKRLVSFFYTGCTGPALRVRPE